MSDCESLFNTAAMQEICDLGLPTYAAAGENDKDGFQVFTPDFIVKDMIDAVGRSEIEKPERVILEPTSGDGAFTGRILELRLKKLLRDKTSYLANSLRALSTIYSIEMDYDLAVKQRSNMFTVFMHYARKSKIQIDEGYVELAKKILVSNVIWAMTNKDMELSIVREVAYRMPEAEAGELIAIKFPVWDIHDDLSFEVQEEDVDI